MLGVYNAFGQYYRFAAAAMAPPDYKAKAISLVQTAEGALNEINNLLVQIRSLAVDSANTGYNDSNALAANPKLAPSQFMRGIVELRLGDKTKGQADIAAAERADEGVADEFAGYGVTP